MNGNLFTRLFQFAVTGLLGLLAFLATEMWRSSHAVEGKVNEEKVAIEVLSERLRAIAQLDEQRFRDLERRLDQRK